MPWHLIVRVLFVLAVTYAAVLVRPFTAEIWTNAIVGALLGLVIIGVETRLREAEVTDLLGALIGGAIGLGLAKTIGAALFWADASDARVAFLHSFTLLVFPYLGIVMGARKGEWLQPARLVSLVRESGESATSWSSLSTNWGMTRVPSRKPVSHTSAIRPSMMTLVSSSR
jgi:hypothetical protein